MSGHRCFCSQSREAFSAQRVSVSVRCLLRHWPSDAQALTDREFKDKLVVILAGYERCMQGLLDVNEGLASRFSRSFLFPDMDAAAVASLLTSQLRRTYVSVKLPAGLELAPDAADALLQLAVQVAAQPAFSNGRTVDTWRKNTYSARANRVQLSDDSQQPVDRRVTLADLQKGCRFITLAKPAFISGGDSLSRNNIQPPAPERRKPARSAAAVQIAPPPAGASGGNSSAVFVNLPSLAAAAPSASACAAAATLCASPGSASISQSEASPADDAAQPQQQQPSPPASKGLLDRLFDLGVRTAEMTRSALENGAVGTFLPGMLWLADGTSDEDRMADVQRLQAECEAMLAEFCRQVRALCNLTEPTTPLLVHHGARLSVALEEWPGAGRIPATAQCFVHIVA